MARLLSMAFIGVVMAAVLHYSAAETTHVVGDNIGWTVPTGGAATYTSWASGKQFVVGDILVFNFVTNNHDVVEVSKESFDACDFSSTIGSIISTGPANVSITTAGDHYYVCTIGRHCDNGQKLAISASATPGGASPPSSTTAPPPPTTTNMPPSTPSPTAEVCPPTQAPSPSTKSTPNTARTPSASQGDNSSSSTVIASVFVSMVSCVVSFFL